MSCKNTAQMSHDSVQSKVGVGLRHPHYREALLGTSSIDFVEVHAENYFAQGGLASELLSALTELYPMSLHSTSMGLGSAQGINTEYLGKLKKLAERINPILISDHACFTWSHFNGRSVHAGDLLPLEFTHESLKVMAENIDRVQSLLGRQILVENLSAYVAFNTSQMSETEFLSELVERTGCGLLVDLNNLIVNARNFSRREPLAVAGQWLAQIPQKSVAEIHLAGYSQVAPGELIIDDHSQPVSDECWTLYADAIERFGAVTTLIEWDNELPSWETLLTQAQQAKAVMQSVQASQRSVAYAS